MVGALLLIAIFAVAGFIVYAQQTAPPNPDVVCPHCQVKGMVRVTATSRKRGVSGGKATGALMTGGLSMFVTGLSRKQAVSHMACTNCGVEWDVE